MAHEHQIADVIKALMVLFERPPSPWTIFRKRIDMRLLRNIDPLLSDRRLVEYAVTPVELATSGSPSPQLPFHFFFYVTGDFLDVLLAHSASPSVFSGSRSCLAAFQNVLKTSLKVSHHA